jgi:uncharacterized membrane protein (UPF0127 family)
MKQCGTRNCAVFVCAVFTLLQPLASCAEKKTPVTTLAITTRDGKTVSVRAEIAKTDEERERGFMERKNSPYGTGMLFVFERDQILSFWMKNTPPPLSIAYIESRGVIRDILDLTPFSLKSVTSSVSVRYALEVPQGWFSRAGISVGDALALDF